MSEISGFETIEVFVNEGCGISMKQDHEYEQQTHLVYFPPEFAERVIEKIRECVREIESDQAAT